MIGTANDIVLFLMNAAGDKDKKWEIREYEEKKKRSLSANAYFHLLVGKIASVMKLSTIEVKNQMVCDYGTYNDSPKAIAMSADVDWLKQDSMHLQPTTQFFENSKGVMFRSYFVMKPTHLLDSKEMAKLIDGTIQEAINVGIPEEELLTPAERAKMIAKWGDARKKDELKE